MAATVCHRSLTSFMSSTAMMNMSTKDTAGKMSAYCQHGLNPRQDFTLVQLTDSACLPKTLFPRLVDFQLNVAIQHPAILAPEDA